MCGAPKGLLPAPDGHASLVARLLAILGEVLPGSPVYLLGQHSAYAALGVSQLADAPAGIGPLGGLRALLFEAERLGRDQVLLLACDWPYLSQGLIEKLACHAPSRAAVAPRRDGHWEPLAARFLTVPTLACVERALAEQRHSVQRLFDALGDQAEELPLSPAERALLVDWDTPEDVQPKSP